VLPTCLIGGVVIVGSGLSMGKPVSCTPANTVAYTANVATAQYIIAGPGALEPNNSLTVAARNSLKMRSINDFDLALGKKFPIGERMRLQFDAQIFNALNHPQYIAGSLNQINTVNYTSSAFAGYVTPGSATFNNPAATYSSNPRMIQIGAKFTF
jgi:hypothetical protein